MVIQPVAGQVGAEGDGDVGRGGGQFEIAGVRTFFASLLASLTSRSLVGIIANVNASLVFRKREVLAAPSGAFVEMVVWHVPRPVSGSSHYFKYRLALVHEGECVLRYDNEAGKGDHKHIGEDEWPYRFGGLERLQEDFWSDVESWRKQR